MKLLAGWLPIIIGFDFFGIARVSHKSFPMLLRKTCNLRIRFLEGSQKALLKISCASR